MQPLYLHVPHLFLLWLLYPLPLLRLFHSIDRPFVFLQPLSEIVLLLDVVVLEKLYSLDVEHDEQQCELLPYCR
jgi:hypothetical protein